MVGSILTILSAAINLYSLLCVASIILTWFPGAKYTRVGRFLSALTDPYLNLFSRGGRLIFGNLDMSPIIAIAVLSLSTSVLNRITATGRIYIGGIIASIFSMAWSVCSSIIGLFALFMLIRWVVLLIHHGETSYDSGWYRLDAVLEKPVYKISRTFAKKPISYQTALLISWITLVLVNILGAIVFGIIGNLFLQLPF